MGEIPDIITADEYLAMTGKRSKYSNQEIVLDGKTFHSRAEAQHYKDLALMELHGVISQLELQPEFELVPAFKRDGKHHRAVKYIADFAYIDEDGRKTVVDVKGMRTAVYLLKRKLLLRILPPDVLFVEIDANAWRGRRGRR